MFGWQGRDICPAPGAINVSKKSFPLYFFPKKSTQNRFVINKSGEKGRVEWVDYCKGVGILLVVVGHALGGLQAGGVLADSYAYNFIEEFLYTFHMPLFFFLSGLFVRRSALRSVSGFFLDKMSVLIYPYFIWSIFQGGIQAISTHYANNSLSIVALMKIFYIPIDQYWFLYTMFVMMIIYRLFRVVFDRDVVFFLLAIVGFVLEKSGPYVIQWDVAHCVGSFMIYFAAGAVVSQTSALIRFVGLAPGVHFALAVGGYGAVGIAVAMGISQDPVFTPWFAMLGILATVVVAILMNRHGRFSLIRQWGVFSLEIYVAHVMAAAAIRVILQKIFHITEPSIHIVLGIMASLYVPIALAYLCRMIGYRYAFTLAARPGIKAVAFDERRDEAAVTRAA
jgi:fucose 4-O-acetylase-like acetyltransferase